MTASSSPSTTSAPAGGDVTAAHILPDNIHPAAVPSTPQTPAPAPPASFLAAYDALATSGLAPADAAKAQYGLLADWLTNKPGPLFAELRADRPILVPPLGPVLITRFRDVIEALGLDDIFTVKPAADAIHVIIGANPFILGMDDSAPRDHDQAILRLAVKRDDMEMIRAQVAVACKTIVESAAGADGTLNLVQNYTSTVPLQLAGSYFGIPGPDVPTLGGWLRAMFRATFRNPARDPQIDQAAVAAAAQYRAYVTTLVADAHAHPSGADTVLNRLVAMQADGEASFDDELVMHNLSSLLMGMIDTTNAAVNFAIDAFLKAPPHLQSAAAAAGADDNDLLVTHIFEALRFNPPVPLLARFSAADQLLARGTDHATLIPAGRLVYVAAGSAMLDETELDSPLEFRTDRPPHQYLHLGWGMHRCFGRTLAQVLLVEMVKALLVRSKLRRAPGDAGIPSFDGPFLKSFSVMFD
ncbi:MAG TPA: cytochrome P450 [Humisphaera sp.]|jgi:cytochrome P450|nr:cytochrome P450 [Humisphaera sp.]